MTLVRAGETGFDSSFSHPPADRMVAAGAGFHVGYVSTPPSDPRKNITAAECRSNIAAGMKQLIVFEKSAARANLGAPAGATDGADARRLVRGLGCPDDVPVLTAVDTAFHPNQPLYCRAYADACGPMGIYGGTTILEHTAGLWQIGWVPVAAYSWSGVRSVAGAEDKARAIGAHCLQYKSFMLEGAWLVDPNIAIADFPAWGQPVSAPPSDPPAPPPPATQPQEQDVPHFVEHSGSHAYWINEIDWQAQEWACPISELGIDWRRWNLPTIPVVDGGALDQLYADGHRRPTPLPAVGGGLVPHDHDLANLPSRTGGVIQ